MKIELIKQTFANGRGYKYKPFDYCCRKIKTNPRIVFADERCSEDENWSEDYIPAFMIWHSEIFTEEWGENYERSVYYKIDRCPFCGEPIEISVVGEEDMDDVYKSLTMKREELWTRYNRTDSKNKARLLRKRVQELDDKIEWMYHLCEYKNITEEK